VICRASNDALPAPFGPGNFMKTSRDADEHLTRLDIAALFEFFIELDA
jgi:hypothetical protein